MTSLPRTPDEPGDAEMILAARGGDLNAFGVLYGRHMAAAQRLSRQLTRSPVEADDLVSEAFAKVLESLRAGGGPDSAFRAYLLTTLRNLRYDRLRRDRKLEYSGDLTDHDPGVPFVDTAVQELESRLVAKAFASLPERWRTVLWHTEVEGETPAQVAPILGLTPNGVSALAYRAREGLRQAYLQVHLAEVPGEGCRSTVERLGAWARQGLSRRDRTQVDEHLAGCVRCRQLSEEVSDVNHGLLGTVAALVVGAPWAAGYLASAAATATSAGTALGGAALGGALGTVAGGAALTAGATGGAASSSGLAAAAGAGGLAGAAAAAKFGLVASLLQLPGMAKLGAGVGTAVVAGGLVISLSHVPAQDLKALPPHPITAPSLGAGSPPAAHQPPRAPGTGQRTSGTPSAPGAAGRPGGGTGNAGGTSAGGTRTDPAAPPVEPPGSAPAGGQGSPAATTTPPPTDPGANETRVAMAPLAAGSATSKKKLVAGKQAQLAIPVSNIGDAQITNLVAHVVLPAGMELTNDATTAKAKKKWRCTSAADGADCVLDALDPGGSTLQLKVTVAADAPAQGELSGDIQADGPVNADIPSTELTVTPA
ncbi:MAG: hypothetical protein V7637_6307 [Mycobacteriales bacterium]|jgi:RNA polymerase sigma factor (sigma-70 family)